MTIGDILLIPPHSPADAGGSQVLLGKDNSLGELQRKEFHVLGIRIGSQAAVTAGSTVGVRRRNQDVIRWNVGRLARQLFRFIEKRPRQHATIDDDNGGLISAIVKNQAPRVQSVIDGVRRDGVHVVVDEDRQFQRCDVDGKCAGAKSLVGGG